MHNDANSTRPSCPECGHELPTLESVSLTVGEHDVEDCTLLAVTFHVACACGNEIGLMKRIDDSGELN